MFFNVFYCNIVHVARSFQLVESWISEQCAQHVVCPVVLSCIRFISRLCIRIMQASVHLINFMIIRIFCSPFTILLFFYSNCVFFYLRSYSRQVSSLAGNFSCIYFAIIPFLKTSWALPGWLAKGSNKSVEQEMKFWPKCICTYDMHHACTYASDMHICIMHAHMNHACTYASYMHICIMHAQLHICIMHAHMHHACTYVSCMLM